MGKTIFCGVCRQRAYLLSHRTRLCPAREQIQLLYSYQDMKFVLRSGRRCRSSGVKAVCVATAQTNRSTSTRVLSKYPKASNCSIRRYNLLLTQGVTQKHSRGLRSGAVACPSTGICLLCNFEVAYTFCASPLPKRRVGAHRPLNVIR